MIKADYIHRTNDNNPDRIPDAATYVAPEEAVKLSDHRDIRDIYYVLEISRAFFSTKKWIFEQERDWYDLRLLACVWNAGRISGTRFQRARRKGR